MPRNQNCSELPLTSRVVFHFSMLISPFRRDKTLLSLYVDSLPVWMVADTVPFPYIFTPANHVGTDRNRHRQVGERRQQRRDPGAFFDSYVAK